MTTSRRGTLAALAVALTVLAASACSVAPGGASPSLDPSLGRPVTSNPPGDRVPPMDSPAPIIGEVPEPALQLVRDDLQQRLGVDVGAATIVRAEQVTFSDGSLDCPQPGEMYTQALVEGYRVVVAFEGQEYDYRMAATGTPRLCEARAPGARP